MSNNIDMIFYINLAHRTDRRELIEAELNNFGLKYERFEAHYIPQFGALGCSKSHLDVLKIAKERNYENIIILEDDFQFIVTKQELEEELTKFFDAGLLFGGCLLAYNLFEYEKTKYDFLYRIRNAQTMSGYIVNKRCYDRFISLLEKSNKLLELTKDISKYTCDQSWKELQKNGFWFCFTKRIGIQRPSYSDLERKNVNYGC
jgi:glycosyl transferase family 25